MKMADNLPPSIQIDLNEFKFHLHLKNNSPLTLHFDSPSRRFYLSIIALVVQEMKKSSRIRSVPLQDHFDLLVQLNESVGGAAGSSNKANLMHRIYTKWKNALPNLEEAPLFKVLGRRKEEGNGAIGKIYLFSDKEKDDWANLFEYQGSEENVRLRFAIDRVGANLDDIEILFENSSNEDAWKKFVSSLNLKPGPIEGLSLKKMALPLPDKPSIAVLPFVNMSGDPTQEFFSDGITEDIITALSKVPGLFVIARNSTFIFKEKPVEVKQVSEKLGVRYVLEGSVQRSGVRVRISAQLIDALSGYHIWAERYDRELKDLFTLQDEITLKIINALQVKLSEGEHATTRLKLYQQDGLDCYLKISEGNYYINRGDIEEARQISEEIVTKWPKNPTGYVQLGVTYHADLRTGSTKSPRETLEKAMELTQKALAINDSVPSAHALLSYLYSYKGEYDKAIAEGERAMALAPNQDTGNAAYAYSLLCAGQLKEAIPKMQKAIRLAPIGASTNFNMLGLAYLLAGQFNEAVSALKQALLGNPNFLLPHINLTSTYMALGKEKEAQVEAAEILRINPNFSVDNWARAYSSFKNQSSINEYITRLRKAGLK
jgi:TolB-like protein/Tfp pilus assembly protein PilF